MDARIVAAKTILHREPAPGAAAVGDTVPSGGRRKTAGRALEGDVAIANTAENLELRRQRHDADAIDRFLVTNLEFDGNAGAEGIGRRLLHAEAGLALDGDILAELGAETTLQNAKT